MSYACRVLADSAAPNGARITTLEVTFPRIVLAEFNTHRMLSRNSASSRAIPVEKMLERVQRDPFIPAAWPKNQKGMQAEDDLDALASEAAAGEWLIARDRAVQQTQQLLSMRVHKQIANRLLEPWMWHTVIVTATEWENFFALRCHPMAQPEIRTAAEMMRDAMAASTPRPVALRGWHLPLVTDGERATKEADWVKVSVGRCARVSYLTHDGQRDPAADVALCDKLVASGHMSPTEHVATPHQHPVFRGNFCGWVQYRKTLPNEASWKP